MVIYKSEQPYHHGFADRQKHDIGDTVKVIKVTLTANDPQDTRDAFLSVLGKEVVIREINLWERVNPEDPWHITYEVEVGDSCVFLNNDEVEKV